MSEEVKKSRRGRKAKPGSIKEYFTDVTEKAIVKYNSLDCSLEEKNEIYDKEIHKALKKLAYFTAKSYFLYFSKRYSMEDMENDLLIFAFNNLHMFNPEKINKNGVKSKAFSYFSTICKNEAKHISKINFNQDKSSDDVVENMDLFERNLSLSYSINENLEEDNDNNYIKLVFLGLCKEIKNKIENDKTLKEIDVNVGYSLISIIENFKYINEPTESKMSLFFINNRVIDMICEITNNKYKKQEIKKSLKGFKSLYSNLKENYLSS